MAEQVSPTDIKDHLCFSILKEEYINKKEWNELIFWYNFIAKDKFTFPYFQSFIDTTIKNTIKI